MTLKRSERVFYQKKKIVCRRSTLQKWDERTRFVQTHRKETKRDFSAFEKDAISQIDKVIF